MRTPYLHHIIPSQHTSEVHRKADRARHARRRLPAGERALIGLRHLL